MLAMQASWSYPVPVESDRDAWDSQLRKGLVELAVLGLLARRPLYGSELVDQLGRHPALAVTAGTIYPLLARLSRSGAVSATWQESPVGPPRKYYALTGQGEQRLAAMAAGFGAVSAAITTILEES